MIGFTSVEFRFMLNSSTCVDWCTLTTTGLTPNGDPCNPTASTCYAGSSCLCLNTNGLPCGKCYGDSIPGAICNSNQECFSNSCSGGKCEYVSVTYNCLSNSDCRVHYTCSNNQCLVEPGYNCLKSADCVNGTSCTDNYSKFFGLSN